MSRTGQHIKRLQHEDGPDIGRSDPRTAGNVSELIARIGFLHASSLTYLQANANKKATVRDETRQTRHGHGLGEVPKAMAEAKGSEGGVRLKEADERFHHRGELGL